MNNFLIVVDYQVDFVSGSLGFPKAVELEEKIVAKVEAAKKGGEHVIFTYDTHRDNYLETQEGRNLPVKHCIEGTPEWHLYGKLAKYESDPKTIHFKKGSFGSIPLAEEVAKIAAPDRIELCGVVTDICVLSNAIILKARFPESKIVVDASCCASFDPELHQKALDIMAGVQIEVVGRN